MSNASQEFLGFTWDTAVLRALTEHSPDVVMVLNLDCEIQFINWTAPGLAVEQVVGTPIYHYVPSDQHAGMRECFSRVKGTSQPGGYRNVYSTPEGSVLHWESRVAPVTRDGQVVGFTVFSRDVTERNVRAIELDRFFELSIDFLCIASTDGYFTRVNPTFSRVLGYTEEELVGRPYVDLVHPEDVEATRRQGRRVAEGEHAIHFENRYRTKAGDYRLLTWQALSDPERRRVLAVARDITEQRALEVKLRQSQKMDAVGQLAGGIAHDFNNLMQAVLVNTEFALRGLLPGQEDLRTHLQEIERARERATALTQQLLAFSRKAPVSLKPVNLNALVGSLVTMLRRLIPESIELDFVPGAGLPRVEANPSQVEQIVMNLCVNARDAMRAGGRLTLETAAVSVEAAPPDAQLSGKPGRYVLLRVTDTGEGINAEIKERVFEPFFSTKGPTGGTGLGLATVYGIVKQHGGLIRLDSELGVGSRFTVYLPASERMEEDAAARAGESSHTGQETILVAEDEGLVRSVIVRILEQAGYRVLAAANGREAVQLLKEHRTEVALAILDVVMPELSGPEAYARLLELRPDLPVLFSSGYADGAHFRTQVPSGLTLIAKPFRGPELLQHVRAALAQAQA